MNYIADQEQYSKLLTKDEYRIFTEYLDDNYEELYSNKVGYMVEKINDKYKITLTDNTIISFEDIFKQTIDFRRQMQYNGHLYEQSTIPSPLSPIYSWLN